MNSLRKLLSAAGKNSSQNTAVPTFGYNIFHILEVSAREVVMCRFLADLLNPEGAHDCGSLFLKAFLQDVIKERRINDTLLACTGVIKEYVIDHERRIDIVLRSPCFFLPVEVKIYAGEQEGQCFDYFQYARTFDADTRVVYLTRYGTEPSEYSRRDRNGTGILPEDRIKCISWEKDIYGWLSALLPRTKDPLQSVLRQYIEAIRMFTDRGDRQIMKKNLELLLESEEYFNAGLQVERTMKAAKLKLMQLVFDDFRKAMEPLALKYGLEEETKTFYYFYREKQHERFYDCYSTYPGLNYVVKKAAFRKKSLELWFRIEVEHQMFAGFCLFDHQLISEEGHEEACQIDEISPSLVEEASVFINRDILLPDDWWLAWCYTNGKRQERKYADVPDFMEMNPCAVSLADRRKRAEFIEGALHVFEERLLKQLQ